MSARRHPRGGNRWYNSRIVGARSTLPTIWWRAALIDARAADDQRHARRFLVEGGLGGQAMLPEHVAVVGDQEDPGNRYLLGLRWSLADQAAGPPRRPPAGPRAGAWCWAAGARGVRPRAARPYQRRLVADVRLVDRGRGGQLDVTERRAAVPSRRARVELVRRRRSRRGARPERQEERLFPRRALRRMNELARLDSTSVAYSRGGRGSRPARRSGSSRSRTRGSSDCGYTWTNPAARSSHPASPSRSRSGTCRRGRSGSPIRGAQTGSVLVGYERPETAVRHVGEDAVVVGVLAGQVTHPRGTAEREGRRVVVEGDPPRRSGASDPGP